MTQEVLVTHGLTKRYGNRPVVDQVDLKVEKGQIYGLVGRNGAGKTTLIRMVTGQTVPSGGELSLFGAAGGHELAAMRARTGVMVETPSFYPYLTARQNLEYYRIQRGIPGSRVVDQVLEEVDLADTGKKTFKNFSLGMKQRLGLALALMNRPDFLLLDEPINGLDPEGIVEFRNLLIRLNRERQITVLISSHSLRELEDICSGFALLDGGTIADAGDIHDALGKVHKFQFALEKEVRREDIPFECLSFEAEGRVARIVVRGDAENLMRMLEALHPLFVEEIAVDFEELFLCEVQKRGYMS